MEKLIWKFENEEYWFSEREYSLIFPYLYRFHVKESIDDFFEKEIYIKSDQLLTLKKVITDFIRDFLNDCYQAPSERQLSKNSSNFEKIEFEKQIYKLNYRITDPIGSVIYSMYVFSSYITKALDEGTSIVTVVRG